MVDRLRCTCLYTTTYVNKPMRAHGSMQAVARVDQVWRAEPGGSVTGYLGIALELHNVLKT